MRYLTLSAILGEILDSRTVIVRAMSTPVRSRTQRQRSRRCINCSILLSPNLRRYTVEELNEQMTVLLRTWTMPTPVSLVIYRMLKKMLWTLQCNRKK